MSRSIKSLFKLLAISCVMMFFITCERDDIIPMESSENVFVLSSDEQSIPTITYQLSKAKSLESYFKSKGMAYTRAAQSETIFTLPLGTVNLSSGLGIINEEAGIILSKATSNAYDDWETLSLDASEEVTTTNCE